jgi:hypothetical protein
LALDWTYRVPSAKAWRLTIVSNGANSTFDTILCRHNKYFSQIIGRKFTVGHDIRHLTAKFTVDIIHRPTVGR